MHRPEENFIQGRWDHTAVVGHRLFTRLIEDRSLIPPENLYEVGYDDLVGSELSVMHDIYRHLRLPDWERFERNLKPYLSSIAGYKPNKLEMEPELEAYVHDRWRLVYDTYGYAKEYSP